MVHDLINWLHNTSFRVVENASALNRLTTQYAIEVQEDYPIKLTLAKVKQIITNILRDNSHEGQEGSFQG